MVVDRPSGAWRSDGVLPRTDTSRRDAAGQLTLNALRAQALEVFTTRKNDPQAEFPIKSDDVDSLGPTPFFRVIKAAGLLIGRTGTEVEPTWRR